MSVLMACLAAETTAQNTNDQSKLFDLLRNSIDGRDVSSTPGTDPNEAVVLNAQDYIWSLLYGGVDGLAYVRSLAEFISNPSLPPPSNSDEDCLPLESWVENNIVDTITEGRHRLVRKIVHQLSTKSDEPLDPSVSDVISEDIRRSLDVYPQLGDLIAALSSQIDIQNLVNRPLELSQAEFEWSGSAFKRARRQQREASGTLTIDNPMSTLVAPSQGASNDADKDDQEVVDHALEYSRERLLQLMQSDLANSARTSAVEDPLTRDLRMNLLALSKRVPLQLLSVSSVML
jgi:bromodomain-containing protein 7/9